MKNRIILAVISVPALLTGSCMQTATFVKNAPCPASPNCVSTRAPADDAEHFIEPYLLGNETEAAFESLLLYLNSRDDAEILETEEPQYVHAVFVTSLMRYKDDVEFNLSPLSPGTRVDFRSASRLGYSDLGKNRSRMEDIRREWAERQ